MRLQAQAWGLRPGQHSTSLPVPASVGRASAVVKPRAHAGPSQPRMVGGRAAPSRRSAGAPSPHAAASAMFGARLSGTGAAVFGRSKPPRGAHIRAAVTRRGGRIIISAVLAGVEGSTDVQRLLDVDLKRDERLVVGQLENGLRYAILPNQLPPERFEAHLEIHAGSVDELPHEQGIAHLVEHVTFLGSTKREALLGTGARANAYTDFHHTVFHVHSPLSNIQNGAPMLPMVLDALQEVAFGPAFSLSRIEKERKAVTAEAQMMNTIEYRVDCQLLQYLHPENNLGCRFPIGKMDQVAKWSGSQLKEFWGKWYFPANATLYVVGDLDRDVSAVEALIKQIYGRVPPATTTVEQVERLAALSTAAGDNHQPPAYVALPAASAPGAAAAAGALSSEGGANNGAGGGGGAVLLKQRHAVRPPVTHAWGCGPLDPGFKPASVGIFRHPLLHHFTLSVFCKLPIVPLTKMDQLKHMLLLRILLSTFQFRVNKRYVAADPPFMSIGLDISDSGREGCTVCTLTVTCEPKHWKGATQVAVEEMRRLQRFGVTPGEFERYSSAILRDSEQLAEQRDRIPSLDTLNFVMESLACGHTIMEHQEAHEAMVQLTSLVTIEDCNALARSMLTFASDYGNEAAPLADAAARPSAYTHLGPTRTTSILACLPAYVSDTGAALTVGDPAAAAARAAANMGAAGHIDVDQVDLDAIEAQSRAAALVEEMVPEGAVRFEVDPAEVQAVLTDLSLEVEAPVDVACPPHLIPPEKVDAKLAVLQPTWVPLDTPGPSFGQVTPAPDPEYGIVQRKLSNGIRFNYRRSDNEPKGCLLRVVVPGGKAAEKMEVGPDGFGAVIMGPSALNETGQVGPWSREEIEVFFITNLINIITDGDDENIIMDMHFVVGNGAEQAAFEALHMFLEAPVFSEEGLTRAKTLYLNSKAALGKSLEKATEERVLKEMMGGPDTRRFRDATDEEIEALTLEGVQSTFHRLMDTRAMEVNVVGDIDGEELEGLVLRYLGSVAPRDHPIPATSAAPAVADNNGNGNGSSNGVAAVVAGAPPSTDFPHITQTIRRDVPFDIRHSAWHLQDSDERAAAVIGGQAPARWGPFGTYDPLPALRTDLPPLPPAPVSTFPSPTARKEAAEARRANPLYSSCILMLLQEIINSRLFTTVRDSLGLTYDVSFNVTMMDRVRAGWFTVTVTADPSKIYDALDASVGVLRDMQRNPVNRRELARARTTILTRHESDLKDNAYWLGLITHLQSPSVPWKTVTCLKELVAMYESITVDDIYHAWSHFQLDDDSVFSCVGTSGTGGPVDPPEARLVNGIGTSRMDMEDDDEEPSGGHGGFRNARGGAGPLQQPAQPAAQQMNPLAMFTAMLAAAQSMNLRKALDSNPPGSPAGASSTGPGGSKVDPPGSQ